MPLVKLVYKAFHLCGVLSTVVTFSIRNVHEGFFRVDFVEFIDPHVTVYKLDVYDSECASDNEDYSESDDEITRTVTLKFILETLKMRWSRPITAMLVLSQN